ncbi:diacylglycerol kinase [Marinibactrum halimedae]|uniref:Diacylglycerol kinase n=1 Tax=Marinibactrum halimedae TaxID=1444977 RepID=A0AA37T1F0_9GAMM|nr:diacylglycerol kinase [Marinibactrum halimedae]MCD9459755.1 diacylglycerol kinase [Marinibactrum halimedae]GLS24488.1 diacylglycerol kinase [Marinibactrum halimedae]
MAENPQSFETGTMDALDDDATVYGIKTSVSPITRFYNATRYSIKGLKATFFYEQAFRFEVYALAAAIPLSYLVADSALDYVLLLGSIIFVMIVELLNTGVEMVVDRIGVEHHELSGRAKDAGSAAVFLAILLSLSIWVTLALT